MNVKDVGRAGGAFDELKRGQRKGREARGVVRIVLAVLLVEVPPVEVLRALDQVELDTALAAAILNRSELEAGAERDRQALELRQGTAGFGHAVARQHHFDLVPEVG